MDKSLHIAKYVFCDFITASLVWLLFNLFGEKYIGLNLYFNNINYLISGTFIIAAFWIFVYWFSGYYYDIYHKNCSVDFFQTVVSSFIGVFIISCVLFLYEFVIDLKNCYILFSCLFLLHAISTLIPRIILTHRTIRKINNAKVTFNILLIGNGHEAVKLLNIFRNASKNAYKIVGFVSISDNFNTELIKSCKHLGKFSDIGKIISENKIDEVIIVLDSNDNRELNNIVLDLYNFPIKINICPNFYDNLIWKTELVKIGQLVCLYRLKPQGFSFFEKKVKFIFDKISSLLFIVLFSPLYIFTALGVKLSSEGEIIYKQKRVGLNGKEFYIYKFRSMVKDAERGQAQLSSSNDSRITNFGKFMRMSRLDEIPQFYNVLKGDMSIVGPRPERRYYINKILKYAPEYRILLTIKPGITSLGQVKFGYAQNVEEMLERLKFDILYMNNLSLCLDFKILLTSVLTIIKCNGK